MGKYFIMENYKRENSSVCVFYVRCKIIPGVYANIATFNAIYNYWFRLTVQCNEHVTNVSLPPT